MVELRFGLRTVDLPFMVRIPNVTEAMFDELVDEDIKAELLDGVMIVHSPASPRHNRSAGFLRRLMGDYSEELDLGEIFGPDDLIHLATCRRFAPDIFFLPMHLVPCPLPDEEFEQTPDLVVEVLSASNRDYDLSDKRTAYRQARIREIWFIDQENQQVIIDQRRGRRYMTRIVKDGKIASIAIKGFWIRASWLWADQPPRVMRCLRGLREIMG
jgi:Uma2 family endonuclease